MKSWTVICCVGSVFHGRTAQKASQCTLRSVLTFRSTIRDYRRDGRVAEGARLESVFTRKGNVGSNPTLSARLILKDLEQISWRLPYPATAIFRESRSRRY